MLSKIILLYLQHAAVSRRTARNNVLSLLKIFERVRGRPVNASLVGLSDLTGALIRTFQAMTVAAYCASADPDEASQREAKERAMRTSRSMVSQARSLFTRRGEIDLLDFYDTHGLKLPATIDGFMTVKLRGRIVPSDYKPPGDSVVEQTFAQIELMRSDRQIYLAFWFAVGCGLRRKEVWFCRWEYLRLVEGQPWICGGIGKDGREINVPMQRRAFESVEPLRKDAGWVIEERSDRPARRLGRWMRGLGWNTRKTMHELRAYSGSLIYQRNPVAAMRFLRHKSIAVTEKHYVRYGIDLRAVEVL